MHVYTSWAISDQAHSRPCIPSKFCYASVFSPDYSSNPCTLEAWAVTYDCPAGRTAVTPHIFTEVCQPAGTTVANTTSCPTAVFAHQCTARIHLRQQASWSEPAKWQQGQPGHGPWGWCSQSPAAAPAAACSTYLEALCRYTDCFACCIVDRPITAWTVAGAWAVSTGNLCNSPIKMWSTTMFPQLF